MKTKITKLQLTLAATLIVGQISAQQGVTQFGRPTGQPAFPVEEFIELPDHNAPKPEQWTRVSKPQAQWANSNQRYAKHEVPQQGLTSSLRLTAWQGETLNAQALVWSGADAGNITLAFTPFKSGSRTLPASALSASFLRYTMADYLLNGNNCGHRDHAKLDSVMVADVIDHITPQLALPAMTTQPLWVQCHVPVGTPAGTYKGNLVVSLDGKTLKSLPLQIEVKNRSIGAPSDYAFHLDLWQSPYAVARYHQVEP